MNQDDADKIRQQATANAQPLVDALAPLYLGRTCPLKQALNRECDGPKCMLYTPLNDNPKKPDAITGGACGLTLTVNRVTELVNVAEGLSHAIKNLVAASSAPQIIKT